MATGRSTRRRRFRLSAVLLTVCCFAASVCAAAPGLANKPADEPEAVRRGKELESSRRWSEAIEFYEQTSKDWPDSRHLSYGLRRAKIQFSIERRYGDKSFVDQLLPLPRAKAQSYFDDVLTKVERHYVDPVSPTTFVAHGTESLYHALTNSKFLAKNLPAANSPKIQQVRRQLYDQYWNRQVEGLSGARQVIEEVCEIASRELSLTPGCVVMEYVFGGCNALDDYSSYLTPGRLDDLYSNIEGEFVGIGIEMKAEQGAGLRLMNVLADSPAEEGGCRGGDLIVSIDGTDSRNLSTEEAAGLLQGSPNSRVTLELLGPKDGDKPRRAALVRRAVKVRSIPVVKLIDSKEKVGYIRMTGFQKNSAEELDQALAQLHREGARSLIWDLRGNPGGLLNAAVEVLDRFIDNGLLVRTEGRTEDQNWNYSAQPGGTSNLPLVVLVDGDSASASEIVAGAIRDHHRGQLVGRKTYGKWSVQTILPAKSNTGLRLTTAKFFSPSGQTFGKIGVEPDVPVDRSGEVVAAYRGRTSGEILEDADVQAGLEALRRQVATRK